MLPISDNVLYYGPKRPITAGTPLANLALVKAEARNKTDPIYMYVLLQDKNAVQFTASVY